MNSTQLFDRGRLLIVIIGHYNIHCENSNWLKILHIYISIVGFWTDNFLIWVKAYYYFKNIHELTCTIQKGIKILYIYLSSNDFLVWVCVTCSCTVSDVWGITHLYINLNGKFTIIGYKMYHVSTRFGLKQRLVHMKRTS